MIPSQTPLRHAFSAALVVLTTACALPPGPSVEAELTGAATITLDNDGDRLEGTAKLTLSRPPGEGGLARLTVRAITTNLLDFQTTVTADDPSLIELMPGEETVVGFHFTGTPRRASPPRPVWERACDVEASMTTRDTFTLTAEMFDSVTDAEGRSGDTTVVGTGNLLRFPGAVVAPPVSAVGATWSRRFGGEKNDLVSGVAIDASGNMLVGGTTQGSIDFGQGPIGPGNFVAKVAPGGQVIYSRPLGGNTHPPRVAAAGAFEIVAGIFVDEIEIGGKTLAAPPGATGFYAARIDETGNVLWVESFVAPAHLFLSFVGVDPNGGISLSGNLAGEAPVDFGGGPLAGTSMYGTFILGLDASGSHVYSHRFSDTQAIDGMAVDPSGGVVVAGRLFEDVDFGGGPLPSTVSGEPWVAKFDATGAHVWSQLMPWTESPALPCVATDAAANVVIAVGGDVAKLDAGGTLLWTKTTDASMSPSSVALDDTGRIVLSGTYQGNPGVLDEAHESGQSSAHFLAHLDATGSVTRAAPIGCDGNIAQLSHRPGTPGVALTATFRSFATVDQGVLVSAGGEDMLAAMIMP